MAFEFLDSAERTDQGRKRKNNEDSILRLPAHGVFCVADGMGGAAEGDVASAALVENLEAAFASSGTAAMRLDQTLALIQSAVNKASAWIKERADDHGNKGTGTTVVLIAFSQERPQQAMACHAGDSRLYRFRDGKLSQVTRDHSVASMAGVADEKDLPAMFRSVITRAVGLQERVDLEQTPTDVRPGDLFLICSDGLSRMVNDALIAKVIQNHRDGELTPLAQALVDEANRAGGDDNISVVLIRVGTLPPARHEAEDPQTPTPATGDEDGKTLVMGDRIRDKSDARDTVYGEARQPPSAGHHLGMIGGVLAVALMIGILAVVWKLRGDGVVGPKSTLPDALMPAEVSAPAALPAATLPVPTATTVDATPPAPAPPATTSPTAPATTVADVVEVPAVRQVREYVRNGRREAAQLQTLLPAIAALLEFTQTNDPALRAYLETELNLWTAGMDRMDSWLTRQTPPGGNGADVDAQAADMRRRASAHRDAAIRRLADIEAAIPRVIGEVWSPHQNAATAPALSELTAAVNRAAILMPAKDASTQAEWRRLILDVLQQVQTVLPALKPAMGP